MDTYRVVLKPCSAISNFPSSDTLFGAIMWGIRETLGETKVKEYIDKFSIGQPPFVVSSSFPILKTDLLFFPKPITAAPKSENMERLTERIVKNHNKKHLIGVIESYKRFRKVKYVSIGVFKKLLEGVTENVLFSAYLTKDIILSAIGEGIDSDYGDEIKLFAGLLFLKEEFDVIREILPRRLLEQGIIIRNLIDRISCSTAGEGQLFYTEETFVSHLCLLYFFIRTCEMELNTLIPALKYLEDTGIGRDRTVGRNQFKISQPVIANLNFNGESNRFVCLSRYIPQKDEIIFPPQTTYELISIHSKVESRHEFKGADIWKSHFFYFVEGSILEAKEKKEYYGMTPKAKKLRNQTIIQNGLCLPVFGKLGG